MKYYLQEKYFIEHIDIHEKSACLINKQGNCLFSYIYIIAYQSIIQALFNLIIANTFSGRDDIAILT